MFFNVLILSNAWKHLEDKLNMQKWIFLILAFNFGIAIWEDRIF